MDPRPTLLEREVEMEALADLLASTTDGRGGGLAVIEGPAGIGKTRLMREVVGLGRTRGHQVLTARGGAVEQTFPFGVVRELLGGPISGAADMKREALVAGPARHARAALELADPLPEGDATLPVMLGLTLICSRLADERPLLIAVDDSHWADRSTLNWLTFFAGRLAELPIAVVLATRPVKPGAEGAPLLSIVGQAGVKCVRPRLLSETAVAELVRATYAEASSEFIAACYEVTGGNPFLLRELLTGSESDGIAPDRSGAAVVRRYVPESLARMVLRRMAALGPEAEAVASMLSVLEPGASLSLVAELAGLDVEAVEHLVDLLRTSGVLGSGGPLDFAHPLLRAAVEAAMTDGQRSRLHRRAAALLAVSGASATRRATHLLLAAPTSDPATAVTLREAAEDALARGAPAEAARFLQRALEEPPVPADRPRVALELARARLRANDVDVLPALCEAIERETDPVHQARAAIDLWVPDPSWVARVHSIWDHVARAVDNADRELAMHLDACPRLEAHEATVDRLRRFGQLQGTTTGEQVVLSKLAFALAVTGCASASQVIEIMARAFPESLDIRRFESMAEGVARYDGVWAMLFAGSLAGVLDRLQKGMKGCADQGLEFPVAHFHDSASEVAFRSGDLARMEHLADASLALHRRYSNLVATLGTGPMARLVLARLYREGPHVAVGLVPDFDRPVDVLTAPVAVASGAVAAASGDDQRGVVLLLEAGAALEAAGVRNPAVWPWRAIVAPSLAALGRTAEAEETLKVGLERAEAFGATLPLAQLHRAAALVHMEDVQRAEVHLCEAVAHGEQAGALFELAQALCDLGALLRRTGRRTESRDPLGHARELATRAGARPLAARAEHELRAGGARPRRIALTGLAALTPMERRVAELGARDLSNAEIARELFISVKTVEMHLRNGYRKLGVRSRSELRSHVSG